MLLFVNTNFIHWNSQFINNIIITKSKILLPQTYVTLCDLSRYRLSCLCPLVFLLIKDFYIIWLSNLFTLSGPDNGYSRKAPCPLNYISTIYTTNKQGQKGQKINTYIVLQSNNFKIDRLESHTILSLGAIKPKSLNNLAKHRLSSPILEEEEL